MAAFCAAAVLLTLVGCSARTASTAENFQKTAEGLKYTVKVQDSSQAGVQKELEAEKNGSDIQATFTVFDTDADAISGYSTQKESLPSSGKTVDSDVYNRYTVTNGEIYYALIRIDNTLLICKANTSQEKEADALISALKY